MNIDCSACQERDLDLVFMDLLVGYVDFGSWLSGWLGELSAGRWAGVAHSVTAGGEGESDLIFSWQRDDGAIEWILIENKIGAEFQERQSERYHLRGKMHVLAGHCNDFRTLLLAPRSYLDEKAGSHIFDHVLSYEEVLDWMERQKSDASLRLKRAIVVAAIEKRKRGFQCVPNLVVMDFWQGCKALVDRDYPSLKLHMSSSLRAGGSDALTFSAEALPKRFSMWLRVPKSGEAYVDLRFAGAAHRLEHARQCFGENPLQGFQWVVAGRATLALQRKCIGISAQAPFFEQQGAILGALDELDKLRLWALENVNNLNSFLG